ATGPRTTPIPPPTTATARRTTPPAPESRKTDASVGVRMPHAAEQREHDDLEIQPERPVLDVVEVVLDALLEVGIAAPAVHLGPAGDPGLHHVLLHVLRHLLLELRDEHRPLRARPDDRHLALEHVDELRQLIEARAAQERPEAGRPAL